MRAQIREARDFSYMLSAPRVWNLSSFIILHFINLVIIIVIRKDVV